METIAYQNGEGGDAALVSSLHPNLGKRPMSVNAWRAVPIRYHDTALVDLDPQPGAGGNRGRQHRPVYQ